MKLNRKAEKHKAKLIGNIIKKGDKQFGDGAIQLLSSKSIKSLVSTTISTGSPDLDGILAKDKHGKFGMPIGRIVGISGKEASGKTTLIISLMKSVQEMGGLAALIETEHAFDPDYAKALGVDITELVLSQPRYLEEGLDMVSLLIDTFEQAKDEYYTETGSEWEVPMFIGFDSIAGIPPKAEWEAGSFEDEQALGLHARKLSKFFRKISSRISSERICLACTNQVKTDTGIKYGSKDTEIGGAALKFHASIRLDLRRISFLKENKDGDPYGILTSARTVKNKLMPPFKKVEIPIIFGEGISYPRSLYNALIRNDLIKKEKNTFILIYKIEGDKHVLRVAYEKPFIEELKKLIESSPRAKKAIEKKLIKKAS
uniref:Putative RecA n=1 Tax=viral metagenome TaxID=1070528 RepID=A0A6M3K0A2_9ZZZZ